MWVKVWSLQTIFIYNIIPTNQTLANYNFPISLPWSRMRIIMYLVKGLKVVAKCCLNWFFLMMTYIVLLNNQ